MRPLGFRPSPPTIADLYFCIHAYQAVCKACISSGDGWARLSVESRKMNKNFGMAVLRAVSQTRAEDRPPPCGTTTNETQPFGHRRGKKIDVPDAVGAASGPRSEPVQPLPKWRPEHSCGRRSSGTC